MFLANLHTAVGSDHSRHWDIIALVESHIAAIATTRGKVDGRCRPGQQRHKQLRGRHVRQSGDIEYRNWLP